MSSQIEELIVDLIATRKFAGGQRLVEAELAATFNVSRVPVREALRRLDSQGIVSVVPHRGTYVTVYDEARIGRVAEARYVLEMIATRDAMRRVAENARVFEGLDNIIYEMRRACLAGNRMEVYRADIAYHTEVCRISGNDVVAKLWDALSRQVFICFGYLTETYPDLDSIVLTHLDHRSFLVDGMVSHIEAFVAQHIGGLQQP